MITFVAEGCLLRKWERHDLEPCLLLVRSNIVYHMYMIHPERKIVTYNFQDYLIEKMSPIYIYKYILYLYLYICTYSHIYIIATIAWNKSSFHHTSSHSPFTPSDFSHLTRASAEGSTWSKKGSPLHFQHPIIQHPSDPMISTARCFHCSHWVCEQSSSLLLLVAPGFYCAEVCANLCSALPLLTSSHLKCRHFPNHRQFPSIHFGTLALHHMSFRVSPR